MQQSKRCAHSDQQRLKTSDSICVHCLLELASKSRAHNESLAHPFQLSPEMTSLIAEEFELHGYLGRGGMGGVFKVRERKTGKDYAAKFLDIQYELVPAIAERFIRESKALTTLSHENIVRFHRFLTSNKACCIILEYVDGFTLRSLMKAGQFNLEEVLDCAIQLCNALEEAHSQGVVHRDLKPENILLTDSGVLKLTDFGIAKLPRETAMGRLTQTGQILGSPHYMSPEQLEEPLLVDERADIYSFGVLFYELLMGKLPLGRFPNPSQFHSDYKVVDQLLLKTLERDPADRIQSTSELKCQLEEIQSKLYQGDRTRIPRALGLLLFVTTLVFLLIKLPDIAVWRRSRALGSLDLNGNGIGRFPYGLDFDDDGDGRRAYLGGGNDFNDRDALVVENAGNGLFGNPTVVSTGIEPGNFSVLVEDLNRDGNQDVVTTYSKTNSMSIAMGRGDGRFAPIVRLATGNEPTGVIAADLDGDHWLDLAVVNVRDGDIRLFLNKGDGSFGMGIDFDVGNENAQAIAVADFNEDGHLDLAIPDPGIAQIGLLFGKGDGSFQSLKNIPAVGACLSIAVADFNGDGHVDMATTNPNDRTLSVLLGNGDGRFQTAIVRTLNAGPLGIRAADLNSDGKMDLVITANTGNVIHVLLGKGQGKFYMAKDLSLNCPGPLFLADYNGDGALDIAVGSHQSEQLAIFHGDGFGGFAAPTLFLAGNGCRSIFAADVNNDGRLDIVTGNEKSQDTIVLLGK